MHRIAIWAQTVLVPTLGPLGLFVVAFLDSSFLSLPEINDLLVVTAAIAEPATAWVAVAMATLGSFVGCAVLWWLGRRGGEAVLVRRFGRERAEQARAAFHRWDILALAVPALLPPPMPFKIFVLASGVFAFPFARFAATILISRGLRYASWSVLGLLYGQRALGMLQALDAWSERRLPAILAVSLALAAVAVSLYLLRRRGRGAPGVGEAH
jgi:membrane protein YqaA with SNARE-associated domain